MAWHEMARQREEMARDGGQKMCHTSGVTCMSHPHLWELLTALLIPMATNLHGVFFSPPNRGRNGLMGFCTSLPVCCHFQSTFLH